MAGRPKTRQEKEVYQTVKYHNSAICQRLNELINEDNQKELCEKLGVTPRTVYHWKKGQARPDLDKLAALADYLGVTVDYLVGRIKNDAPDMETAKIAERFGISVETMDAMRRITKIKREALERVEAIDKEFFSKDVMREKLKNIMSISDFDSSLSALGDFIKSQKDTVEGEYGEQLYIATEGELALLAVDTLLASEEGLYLLRMMGRIFSSETDEETKMNAFARVIDQLSMIRRASK